MTRSQTYLGITSRRDEGEIDSLVVMFPNLRLHRLRARHRRLAAHQRRPRAERPPGGLCDLPEHRRPRGVLLLEGVHGVEVVDFLVPHLLC